jgi:two-component system, NtrC family, sensor kinase
MEKAGVRVLDELGESPGPVRGNSGKLQQVFLNLILNARDAMDGGGTLRLSAESTDSSLRIRIADSGCGISEADLARIYDPFFTTKTAKKGTGLGLSITYGIVKEHAGSIAVSSQPGQGTEFLLEFPLARKPVNA